MSNSGLISLVGLSPNHYNGRNGYIIDRITPHCIVGNFTLETLPQLFDDEGTSCNYAIAEDGRIALICDESNGTFCSSNYNNDNRAITIECSCSRYSPYEFNKDVFRSLVKLSADICKRNNMDHCVFVPFEQGGADYDPPVGECHITLHRFFANKACPGYWFVSQLDRFVKEVNETIKNDNAVFDYPVAGFIVQVGAFKNNKYADATANKANESGVLAKPADVKYNRVTDMFEVTCGFFTDLTSAQVIGSALQSKGFSTYIKSSYGDN